MDIAEEENRAEAQSALPQAAVADGTPDPFTENEPVSPFKASEVSRVASDSGLLRTNRAPEKTNAKSKLSKLRVAPAKEIIKMAGTGRVRLPLQSLTYDGSIEAGRPSGFGRISDLANGSSLVARFESGRPRKGLRISSEGHEYLGEFHPTLSGGIFHGQGKLTFSNGDVYEGEFRDGHFHGYGTYTSINGTKISCMQWINDSVSGLVRVTASDGSSFVTCLNGKSRGLIENRCLIQFGDGSFFESSASGSGGDLPNFEPGHAGLLTDLMGKPTVRYVSEGAQRKPQRVLLATSSKLFGLNFSVNRSLDTFYHAEVLMAIHQRINTALAVSLATTQVEYFVDNNTEMIRKHLLTHSIIRILENQNRAALCLLGSFGSDIEPNAHLLTSSVGSLVQFESPRICGFECSNDVQGLRMLYPTEEKCIKPYDEIRRTLDVFSPALSVILITANTAESVLKLSECLSNFGTPIAVCIMSSEGVSDCSSLADAYALLSLRLVM